MSYLKQFGELGRDDIEIAGGKAANLGELTRAGFPVPHGFVVSTDGYRAFVAARGIGCARSWTSPGRPTPNRRRTRSRRFRRRSAR